MFVCGSHDLSLVLRFGQVGKEDRSELKKVETNVGSNSVVEEEKKKKRAERFGGVGV